MAENEPQDPGLPEDARLTSLEQRLRRAQSEEAVRTGEARKPADRNEAASHLRSFSGRAMRLVSSVALARAGIVEWNHIADAVLHVRALSEDFIESYLDSEWPAVAYCVGVFRMEGRGVTLFDEVEGDHFTILGMPLLPLLEALRDRDLMAS